MKRLLSILLILCMVLSLAPVSAHAWKIIEKDGTCGENLTWKLDSTGLLTISGTGPMEDYHLTFVSNGSDDYYTSTSPFDSLYGMQKVVIEPGVTSIGTCAFYSCKYLESITIPDSVTTIGSSAFGECGVLTSIAIPNSVTTIGNSAFSECTALTSINIPDGVTSIGDSAFRACKSLTGIEIPNGVTRIGSSAFSGCKSLTGIELPDSVTTIGNNAFRGCSGLTSIVLPDGVTSIGAAAFDSCSSLTSVTIPDGVTSIDYDTFHGCACLTGIELPDSVTTIGNNAFRGCSGLTSIVLPDGVTSIGAAAFDSCSSLTSVTIPDGVTSIDYDTFHGCACLTGIVIPDGVTSIGESAFMDCASLTGIKIPDGVTRIGIYTFFGCSSLTSIEIPDSVTSIEREAFEGCTSLTGIDLPDGVTSIGRMAFKGCTGLTEIKIPSRIETIDGWVFSQCSALKDVYYHGTQEEWDAIDIHEQATEDETDYFHAAELHLQVHDLPAWTETKRATCTESGAEESVCTICGKTETREIPALGHVPADAGVVTAPTCEAQGYTTHTCTRCGETYQDSFVEATGHDYGAWTETKAPTCTEQGEETRICANDPSHIETRPLDALGHQWGDWEIIEPPAGAQTCLQVRTCERCGATESEEIPYVPHVHEYSAVVTAPTCTEQGYTTHTCSCGDTYVDTYVDALGHDLETVPQVNATCTKAGHTAIQRCRRCGTVLDPGEVIPAEGHKTETRNFKKANCTDPGYTGDEYCWVCGKLLKKGKEIPPKGHQWGPWEVVEAPTKTEVGQDQRACTVCGGVETRITKSLNDRNPFKDVSPDAFYFDPVIWAVTHDPQITDGTSKNTFSPDATCTRGQVVTFLWRAKGCPEPQNSQNRFRDVHTGDYFYKAVLWAVEKGITDGTSATTFSPNEPCTRGHVVTFLWRCEGSPASDGYTFKDVPDNAYYAKAVRWAVEWSITDGTTDTTFSPDAPCTRGQIVTFLYRALSDARATVPRLISREEGIAYCQSVFRSIKREYPHAVPVMGYYTRYRDAEGRIATYVRITYTIGNDSTKWTETVLFVGGNEIPDPDVFYKQMADRYFGATSIHYLTLRTEVALAAADHYPGGILTRDQF